MKKLLIMLMVVAMASFLFVGCIPVTPPIPDEDEEPAVAVTGVTLDQATLALTIGDAAVTLVATIEPDDATDTSVIWVSSDRTVVVVAAGVVTPLNAGISAITATTVDGGFVATCVVTVTAADEPVEPVEPTDAPSITSVWEADDGYINAGEASGEINVIGCSVEGSMVKLYLDDELIGTTAASKTRSGYAMFEFKFLDIDLGKDGEKTLHATAKEVGLAVSDPSEPYTFILDTELPEVDTVTIDGKVLKDGDLVFFLVDSEFKKLTVEMREPVSLVIPPGIEPDDFEPIISAFGIEWATFAISEDGLTLTLAPSTAWPAGGGLFYTYTADIAGPQEFTYAADLLKDAAGNKNVKESFTVIFVNVSP